MSTLITTPQDVQTLAMMLAKLTKYGDPDAIPGYEADDLRAITGYGPVTSAPGAQKKALLRNREGHGQGKSSLYGTLPAALATAGVAGYEGLKALAMQKQSPELNAAAKDTLMYVGRSPVGAAWYGVDPDDFANTGQGTELFTINSETRPASGEAVAAYGRGVLDSSLAGKPLVTTATKKLAKRGLAEAIMPLMNRLTSLEVE